MPLIAILVLLIQVSFAFHALKTGRPYWWVFVIMSFPVMGCLIYYFTEVFPNSREHRNAHKTARKIVRALKPDAELHRRAEELEICGSVDNKIALALECMNHQMYDDAVKLYESCLQGAFQTDGALLFGLARAAVEAADWNKATVTIARIKAVAPTLRPQEVRLLEARILEGQGNTDAALAIYRELVPVFVGFEAHCRYGDLLSRLGQHEAASHVFDEVIKRAKRFKSAIDEEQEWVSFARRSIVNS
ncbi:MAG: hypothetical protein JWN23_1045 [Rhodocyclales bacterium]|nr:hypothetical protein [Rhodocyclales bacterium]